MAVSKPKETKVQMPKKVSEAIKKNFYVPDFGMSVRERGAHFFDWAFRFYPEQPVAWNYVYRALMGGRTPRLDSDEVKWLKHRSGVIRRYLIQRYGRYLATIPAQGAYATDNTDGLVEQGMEPRGRRWISAVRNMQELVDICDIKNVKKPKNRAFVQRLVKGSGAPLALMTGSTLQKLRLLPETTKPTSGSKPTTGTSGSTKPTSGSKPTTGTSGSKK